MGRETNRGTGTTHYSKRWVAKGVKLNKPRKFATKCYTRKKSNGGIADLSVATKHFKAFPQDRVFSKFLFFSFFLFFSLTFFISLPIDQFLFNFFFLFFSSSSALFALLFRSLYLPFVKCANRRFYWLYLKVTICQSIFHFPQLMGCKWVPSIVQRFR